MKPRLLHATVLSAILASLLVTSASAADGYAEPPFRYYSVADGLTQSEVYDIAQDRAGFLWFSTQRGLNRFDGREFEALTIADGLPSNTLTALTVDVDNTIWVGDARGGISLVRGGRVVTAIPPIGELSTPILDIEIAGSQVLAIADGIGLLDVSRRDDGYVMTPIGGVDIDAQYLVVTDGVIWIVAASGLYRLGDDGRAIERVAADVRQAHSDGESLWVVDSSSRIGVWRDGELIVRAEIPATGTINGIITERDGTVWISSETELFSLAASAPAPAEVVLRHTGFDNIATMIFDREGTLWLSSNARLVRFLGDRFRHYKLQTGADPQTVWAITADDDGRLWFGTQTGLIRRNIDETISTFGPEHGLPAGSLRDLVTGESGQLWIGIRGEGLFEFDLGSERARLIEGTERLEVLDVDLAGEGVVWFSTAENGVFRYSSADDRLETFATPKNTSVYTLDVWQDGSVWYGADEVALVHLTRLNETEFRQQLYDRNNGLQHDLFNHVQVTGEGEAWVATEEGGLYRLSNERFESYSPPNAPYVDQTIYVVQPLPDGTVVVGGEQGLYQFLPGADRTVHYNQLAGFVGLETNVHATYVDADDGLWVGTVDGVSRMDMMMPMPAHIELTPQILRIETALDQLEIVDGAEIQPGQRGAFVEFGAVSLTNPRSIEFSYKLDGADSDWGAPTTNRTVSYAGVAPGDYRFMVRARYPGGEWSRLPVVRSFTVMPYFWQRPFVIFTALLVLALAIRAGMIYRTRNIQRLNDKLKAEVEERTRSIESAKQKLLDSNEKLSLEIQERKKADQARAEIEARFRRAFENAPIGMGLLDMDGTCSMQIRHCSACSGPVRNRCRRRDSQTSSTRPIVRNLRSSSRNSWMADCRASTRS